RHSPSRRRRIWFSRNGIDPWSKRGGRHAARSDGGHRGVSEKVAVSTGPEGVRMRMFRLVAIVVAGIGLLAFVTLRAQQINPSYFSGLHWRNIGPPRSGYVSVPAGVPGDPTTYYAGMPEGGVWKTTNGGTTWKPIFDEVRVAGVGAVAVAPSDANVIYVGTGNQSGWSFQIVH